MPPILRCVLALAVIIAATTRPALACPYDLDPTFGDGGIANEMLPGDNFNTAYDAVLDEDGGVLLAGQVNLRPAIVRYSASGELDTSFGEGGIATFDLLRGAFFAIALQDDGRIVAAGENYAFGSVQNRFVVARFDEDGDVDESFSDDGFLTTGASGQYAYARDVVVRGDGTIVLIGQVASTGPLYDWRALALFFTAEGEPDDDFGSGGVVDLAPDLVPIVATAAVVVDDDAIAISAIRTETGRVVLVQLDADGTPDESFGDGGRTIVRARAYEEAWNIARDGEGRLYASGNCAPIGAERQTKAFVRRFTPDGHKDRSYGNRGKAVAGLARRILVRGLAVDDDGVAVVAGAFSSWRRGGVLVRFTDDGERDLAFGEYGIERFRDHAIGSGFHAAVLQDDGRIVAAGIRDTQPVAVRYEGGAWDGVEMCVMGCGDGVIGPHEECEDGNAVGGDGCSAECLLE